MRRRAVYEYRNLTLSGEPAEKINLNDFIELDTFLDYTLAQHLEDLASEGIELISVVGRVHLFSDGTTRAFEEVEEGVPMDRMDAATYLLLVGGLLTSAGLPVEDSSLRCTGGR